jgi:hypothetical protein
MKLWLLRRCETLPSDDDPWKPWFNKAFGFVVRAGSEQEARALAHANSGDEKIPRTRTPWLDKTYSTCDELLSDGPAEVVISDFADA